MSIDEFRDALDVGRMSREAVIFTEDDERWLLG
jgi:hypothetical protein